MEKGILSDLAKLHLDKMEKTSSIEGVKKISNDYVEVIKIMLDVGYSPKDSVLNQLNKRHHKVISNYI